MAELQHHPLVAIVKNELDNLLTANDSGILVALSGGADSTALLLICQQYAQSNGIKLTAAHLNHNLTSTAGDTEVWVTELCRSLSIELFTKSADVAAYARTQHLSTEAAGRELRYGFLAEVAKRLNGYVVVTGHTRDDQAETVIMHILRGSGLQGLRGISKRSQINVSGVPLTVVRPLLEATHTNCIEICQTLGIEYQEDPSNALPDYTRNRIRNELLPLMESITPRATDAIIRLVSNVGDDLNTLDRLLEESGFETKRCPHNVLSFDRTLFNRLEPALRKRALLTAWRLLGAERGYLTQEHVGKMLALAGGPSGKLLTLPNRVLFRTTYRRVLLATEDAYEYCAGPPKLATERELPLGQTVELAPGIGITTRLVDSDATGPSTAGSTVYLDPNLADNGLKLRARLPGDRFNPLGSNSDDKLKRFFINQHVPEWRRDKVPLVTCDRGIVWVVGYRIADWAKLPPDSLNALEIKFDDAESFRRCALD